MTNFQSRLIIGIAYVAITIFGLMYGQITAGVLLATIHFLVLNEFYKITLQNSLTQRIIPIVVGFVVFGLVYANQDSVVNVGRFVMLIIPAVLLFLVYTIFTKTEHFVRDFALMIAGWVYISCSLGLLLRNGNLLFASGNTELLPFNGIQILVVFILIWSNDTFAYLVGRKFGKHPLAHTISPKKTWEGFLGGTLFTVLLTLLLHNFFPFLTIAQYIGLAVIASVFSTLGDLFESRIKRVLDIKDSGTGMGGHGGFLDRFDSVLFAGPACYFYMWHFVVV